MVDVARSGNSRDNDDEENGPADQDKPDVTAGFGRKSRKKKQRSFWKELPILIGVALLLTLVIQTFIARVFVIPSESMEQTLHGCPGCYGDRVLVDKLVYTFGDPEPGEVVVFERPGTWNQSEFSANRSSNGFVSWLQDVGAAFGLASPNEDDVVKRIVAVGGDTVECCDEKNRVLVNDKPLDEPYIFWFAGNNTQEEFPPITVPEGMLWVLGDNRNNSCDSRCQGGGGERGLVPVDNVIGKVRYIVLPPSRWRGVGDHNPQTSQAAAMASSTAAQLAIPGVALAAAFPTVWLGRRVRKAIRGAGERT